MFHVCLFCLCLLLIVLMMSPVPDQPPVCLFLVFHLRRRLSSRHFIWFVLVFVCFVFHLVLIFFPPAGFLISFLLSFAFCSTIFAPWCLQLGRVLLQSHHRCVCSIIRQHTRTTLCLHLFFKHLHFAFLVVWARRILLFCQNSWGYWVDKWSLYFLWIQLFISKRKNVFYFFQRVHNYTLLWELSQYLMSAAPLSALH